MLGLAEDVFFTLSPRMEMQTREQLLFSTVNIRNLVINLISRFYAGKFEDSISKQLTPRGKEKGEKKERTGGRGVVRGKWNKRKVYH